MSQKILDEKRMYSNCCGAGRLYDESDVCSDCKEHAVFDDLEDEVYSESIKNYMTNYKNGCRGCECISQSDCKNKIKR